jgi:uncharacterized protein (TIGR00369 family)
MRLQRGRQSGFILKCKQSGLALTMSPASKFTPEYLEALRNGLKHVPHAVAIGLKIVDVAPSECRLSIPYDRDFIGDVERGVIHGGIITTLLDNACGLAVQMAMSDTISIATLDLRIDYMKPATPGLALFAHATCVKATRNIAFVHGTAYHVEETDPIAACVGTFMLDANRISADKMAEMIGKLPDNTKLWAK